MLLNITPASPSFMIWVYVVPLGLGIGGWLPNLSMLTSRSFGTAHYGAIFGAISMAMNLGVALGPTLAGYMYDGMQTYHGVFIVLLVMLGIAITSIVILRKPNLPQVSCTK
jgi:MFS family permease